MSSVTTMEPPGIGPRKTLFIMVTVVGCIAFLWPKVFYPMMFGGGAGGPAKNLIKDHRGSGCCDVVLDSEESFGNVSLGFGDKTFRKTILIIGDDVISIRQERPPHLRPDSIHPAMRERGRNIPPSSHVIPIVERPAQPPVQPRVVEGRPGPIPGMRPPMGAGSVHQATPKASTMGFLMPMYTIAIVSFFVYTIMKLVFKKPQTNLPYGTQQLQPDPNFHKQVFDQETIGYKRPDDGTTKLGLSHGYSGHHHHHLHHIHENGGHTHDNGKLLTSNYNCSSNIINNNINSSNNSKSHYDHHYDRKEQQQHQQHVCRPYAPNDGDAITIARDDNEQLLELNLLRKKLQETENAMAKIIAQMGKVPTKGKESKETSNGIPPTSTSSSGASPVSNGHAKTVDDSSPSSSSVLPTLIENGHIKSTSAVEQQQPSDSVAKKTSDFIESEKHDQTKPSEKGTVRILGLEMTASCEGGHKWGQQHMTPAKKQTSSLSSNLLNSNVVKKNSNTLEEIPVEPKPIYLEGALPHDSQILISDSEIVTESVVLHDEEDEDSDEPAVVLSSKMTLSLISLDPPNSADDVHVHDKAPSEDSQPATTNGNGPGSTQNDADDEDEEDEPAVDKIVIEEEEYEEEYEDEEVEEEVEEMDDEEEDDHAQKDDIRK